MRKAMRLAGGTLILALAIYGSWSLVVGGAGDTSASERPGDTAQAGVGEASQEGHDEEMAALCARHMEEMRPVMESMMADAMEGITGSTGGMMGGGMMGR